MTRVFGDQAATADRLVRHLVTSGVERGLVGPREVGRIWTRHVLNCAVVGELLPPAATVADVGSGAGLPGLVLAVARPDLRLVLIEPTDRRCRWLHEVSDALGVSVDIRRTRAEDLHGTIHVDVVTARAVARLATLARWTLPLLRPGGALLAIKGRTAPDEVRDARSVLRQAGAGDVEILRCGAGVVDPPATVVRVRVRTPQR